MGVGLYCCGAAIYDFRLFRLMTSLSCPSPVPPSPSTSTPSTPQPHSYRAIRGGLALQPLLSFAYGVSVFLGGYGSFLYHASAGSPLGGQMDIWSIFVMCNAVATLIFYTMATSITSAILPKSRFPPKLCNTILAFACIAFLVWLDNFSWNWHEHFWLGSWDAMYTLLIQFVGSITASAAFLVVCLYALNNKHRAVPFFPLGLVTVAIAFASWTPEELNGECLEIAEQGATSFWQLHAIWHSFLALTLMLIFMYMRSVGVEAEGKGGVGGLGLTEWDFHFLREPQRGEQGEFEERSLEMVAAASNRMYEPPLLAGEAEEDYVYRII
ncbi:hypothetical protein TeGR_g13540 [Tetraparma gracilis]|uniref:Uncharacterized protein n=1 Tax=Tetraparma gracilis TaxID=2962635 RepID=A0ABQ6N492_9STRA|nr:hypothetical protein TeGR_g13540 [Tetraparma gracilis]